MKKVYVLFIRFVCPRSQPFQILRNCIHIRFFAIEKKHENYSHYLSDAAGRISAHALSVVRRVACAHWFIIYILLCLHEPMHFCLKVWWRQVHGSHQHLCRPSCLCRDVFRYWILIKLNWHLYKSLLGWMAGRRGQHKENKSYLSLQCKASEVTIFPISVAIMIMQGFAGTYFFPLRFFYSITRSHTHMRTRAHEREGHTISKSFKSLRIPRLTKNDIIVRWTSLSFAMINHQLSNNKAVLHPHYIEKK